METRWMMDNEEMMITDERPRIHNEYMMNKRWFNDQEMVNDESMMYNSWTIWLTSPPCKKTNVSLLPSMLVLKVPQGDLILPQVLKDTLRTNEFVPPPNSVLKGSKIPIS